MQDKNRIRQVEKYIEEYRKKMRLMANGLAKMLQDGKMTDDELADYIALLASESNMYRIYCEELDTLEEEEDAQ